MIKIKKLFSISPYYSEFELPLLCQNNNDNNNFTSMFTTPRSWKNIYFCFPATFTTAWLWQKKHCFDFTAVWTTLRLLDFFYLFWYYVHYAMVKIKNILHFSILFTTTWRQKKKINLYCTTALTTVDHEKNILLFDLTFTFFHDQKKKKKYCFSFIHWSHCAYIFLHLLHLPVES